MASIDRSPHGSVHDWIVEALRARPDEEIERLQQSSGDYPRFDRVLASALTRPEHLKSHFGLKFQAFLEDSEALNHCTQPAVEGKGSVEHGCTRL